MSIFRTELPLATYPFQVQIADNFTCIGSCFAENIGIRLKNVHISTNINPFGILFNPISMAESLEILLSEKVFDHSDIFEQDGIWRSYMFHSSFNATDANLALSQMNLAIETARTALQKSRFLILTFGTANVFLEKKSGKVVANNHKQAANLFERKLLSVEDISTALSSVLETLKTKLPNIEVVVSVSPVRHIKDGLVQNQRSKARLLLAAETLSERLDFVHYFPAYELIHDDLRDYRFFEKDMIHPNEQAIDYVWDYFQKALCTDALMALNVEIGKLKMAVQHRPFQLQSVDYQNFAKATIFKIQDLSQRFPHLDLSAALDVLQANLIK
jgi:hypothetical protein